MKTATAATPLTVLSVERSPAHQAVIMARKRLNDAISLVDKSVDGSSTPPAETPTSRLIEAGRDFLHEASPLIDHLHAIIAALGDAIDYRHDDGGACRDCSNATSELCTDHANDAATAAVYHAALKAING